MVPGDLRKCRHRRPVPVHGKDAFGDDQAMTVGTAVGGDQPGAVVGVVMAEKKGFGAAKPGTGMHAGMDQLIGQDQVTGPGEGGDDADIGEVTRAEDDRPIGPLDAGKTRLERPV